jgi:hypothetical protein
VVVTPGRPDRTNADRPDVVTDPFENIPAGFFFHPAACAPQTPATLGDEKINQWHGPHFRHLDLSLAKTFPLTERLNWEFRVEGFNVAHTSSYLETNTTLGTGELGKINAVTSNYTHAGRNLL